MDIGPMYERVIGLDVHQAKITGCAIIEHADGCVTHDRREFGGFKRDRQALAEWVRSLNPQVVVMESTGIYWKSPYAALEAVGIIAGVVNARHVRSVPGRKSDVLDCQWLQQLMSYGLLRGGVRPAEEVCALRAVWRQRDMLLSYQARHVQHLQKAMTQMNVQLHHVISDIMGVTGQAIIRAIVAGVRDGATLARLRDRRIKAEEGEIAAALQALDTQRLLCVGKGAEQGHDEGRKEGAVGQHGAGFP